MNGNVNLYDTYRANKDGKRYRVTEVGNETVKLVKLNDEGTRKHAGGRPRIMTIADLFRDFTKVNLPPVTVSKIEPQKLKQEEVEEVIAQTENEAQIEERTVRPLSEEEVEENLRDALEKTDAQLCIRNHDLEVLKEECISLKEENETLHTKLTGETKEIIDLKKTISKMQQQHEAEVADLKDRLMEKEAEANAVKKRKEEILKERTEYADALDNDSVAFEEILSLAETIQLVSTASAKLAKQIIDKTEGRI